MKGMAEINRPSDTLLARLFVRILTTLDQIVTSAKHIFDNYKDETIRLGVVWLCLSFAGFGIHTSIPNQVRNLRYAGTVQRLT